MAKQEPMATDGVGVHPLGPDALLVRFGLTLEACANRAALGFAGALRADPPDGAVEVATALASVLVRFDPDLVARADLADRLGLMLGARDWHDAALPEGRRRWTVPAAFGGDHGPQLEDAAAAAGMDAAEAVRDLCARPLGVLAIGFAPGQPYLGPLGPAWDIPRQTALTPQVPAGALVVAIRQVVLFANASPTGWRQVGRVAFRPARMGTELPFVLRAGDEVRLRPVEPDAFERLLQSGDPDGGATCEDLA